MRKLQSIFLATAAVAMIGCGGSGGGSGTSSRVAFYATDDLNAGYDHVWVTIKQISLGKVGGGGNVVFSSSAGVAVDLRSLRDSNGNRFKFLGCDNDLGGSYDSVSVTMDDDVVLYTTGSSTGLNRVFSGSVGGTKTLSASFPALQFDSGSDDFVIDFDLSTWNENGSEVTDASIKVLFDDPEFENENQHEDVEVEGTISGLSGTAPDFTFTVTENGRSVVVQTNAQTEFENEEEGSLTLANGMHVEVEGFFDANTNTLIADEVEAEEAEGDEVDGSVSNINVLAFTFDLEVDECEDFLPVSTTIHVTTDASTLFRGDECQVFTAAEFFAALALGDEVELEGTYNAETNTFAATRVRLDDED